MKSPQSSEYARLNGRPCPSGAGARSLRLPNKGKDTSLWRVTFVGEGGQDLGGLFRESWREAAEDLAGGVGGLFVPSPNSSRGAGGVSQQETFVPNPNPPVIAAAGSGASSGSASESLKMLHFVGQLMGAALRSQQPLALEMPGIIWKRLLGESTSFRDLEECDARAAAALAAAFPDETTRTRGCSPVGLSTYSLTHSLVYLVQWSIHSLIH